MDENNNQFNENDEGMFGGADLEQGQEIAKNTLNTAFDMGANATKKVAGAGKNAVSSLKNRASKKDDKEDDVSENSDKNEGNHQATSPNSEKGKGGKNEKGNNDNKKRRFCALHDITLIEVPYTEENLLSYDYLMEKAGY